jgi:putative membrane protein
VSEADLKTSDILALDRTRLAAERTLMAWVRTSLSMITFGFTVYKVLQVLREQSKLLILRPHAPRNLGLTLISIGTLALIVACGQYWTYIRQLSPARRYKPWGLAFIVGCLIALLGLLMFGSIVFNAGPFD